MVFCKDEGFNEEQADVGLYFCKPGILACVPFGEIPDSKGMLMYCSSAMDRFEPAMLDLYGATWTGTNQYEMQPGARRYEIYEKNFAGMVGVPSEFNIDEFRSSSAPAQ